MDLPTDRLEKRALKQGFSLIAGIDEAGRGPLAGPVVAAAVIWRPRFAWQRIRDSKAVALAPEREMLAARIRDQLEWSVGVASVEEIDQMNILQATFLAMRRAVEGLPRQPDYCLVDGCWPHLAVQGEKVIRGDSLSQCIAAASLLAKVYRDRLMVELDAQYPGYGLAQHKGYGTPGHLAALQRLGPTACHRTSFAPVAAGKASEIQLELL
jgi:ribonuclease HII